MLKTLTVAFRVSSVQPPRALGTVWMMLLRHTPLTRLFLIAVFVGSRIFPPGQSWYPLAVVVLGTSTSAFACEAVGINAVPLGQAEAARALV